MGRTVFLNGEYIDESAAQVSVFDRGFTMADAVYEVTAVLGGKLVDFAGHETRLRRSLRELDMPSPCDTAELLAIALRSGGSEAAMKPGARAICAAACTAAACAAVAALNDEP